MFESFPMGNEDFSNTHASSEHFFIVLTHNINFVAVWLNVSFGF